MVIAMRIDDTCTNYAKYGLLWDADSCRHVKPRTIEDVLREFSDKCCVHTRDELNLIPELIADYADELRSMGVGV